MELEGQNGNGKKILVYSCSGCSSAAQMANAIAIYLDRKGFAEMSCIAGVGGGVPSLVQKAKSASKIIGLDGCPLRCVEACLNQQKLKCDHHYELSQFGVRKNHHQDFDSIEAERVAEIISQDLQQQNNGHSIGAGI